MANKKYGFIYITINKINDKKYIGQKKYNKNWITYLGSGIALKNAINKYGIENFERKIIEDCNSKKELDDREIYWIKFYDAVNSDMFYNIASGGDGGNVIAGYNDKQKEELSNKLSKIRKGKVNIGKNNGNARSIICLNTMEIFETINEASLKYGISKDAIQQCCSPSFKTKTAGILSLTNERMIWEYFDEHKEYKYVPYKRVYKSDGIHILCVTTNKLYNSLKTASEETGVSLYLINRCCKNEIESTHGYIFKFEN